MKFKYKILLPLIFLTACQTSGYTFTGLQDAESDYQRTSIRWTSGSTTAIYMKAVNENNTLGICGYYITDGAVQAAIEEVYFSEGEVYIGNQKVTFSARFMNEQNENSSDEYVAACVKTETPFRDSFKFQRLRVKGPRFVTIGL